MASTSSFLLAFRLKSGFPHVGWGCKFPDLYPRRLCILRLAGAAPGDPVIGVSATSARTMLLELLAFFGLQRFAFRWYSCRRGGATSLFRAYGSLDKVLVRGRWVSTRTARLYITEGVAAAIGASTTSGERALLAQFAALWLGASGQGGQPALLSGFRA